MGRGDKKTKKGKIAIGSFGVLRPHNEAPRVKVKIKEKKVIKAKK